MSVDVYASFSHQPKRSIFQWVRQEESTKVSWGRVNSTPVWEPCNANADIIDASVLWERINMALKLFPRRNRINWRAKLSRLFQGAGLVISTLWSNCYNHVDKQPYSWNFVTFLSVENYFGHKTTTAIHRFKGSLQRMRCHPLRNK